MRRDRDQKNSGFRLPAALIVGLMMLWPPLGLQAADRKGWYVEGGLGAGPIESANINGLGARLHADFGAPLFSISTGRAFHNGLRVALEWAHRSNDVEILEISGSQDDVVAGSSDRVRARSYFLNVFYNIENKSNFSPYLGFGLGMADLDYALSDSQTSESILDDNDQAFAWQVIAGVEVGLSSAWRVNADYRYWRAPEVRMTTSAQSPVKTSLSSHSIWLSLSYFLSEQSEARQSRVTVEPHKPGPYITFNAGGGFAQDADLDSSQANLDGYRVGPALSLALGKRISDRFRWEIEGSYRSNNAQIVDFGRQLGEELADGEVQASSLMANGFYDFRRSGKVRPYAGVGAGLSRVEFDVGVKPTGQAFLRDAQTETSFQVILGTGAQVSDRLRFTLEYRYWFAPWLSVRDPEGVKLDTHHNIHMVLLGLQYRLGH